ncbi:hypothetical protein RF11_05409 [Thelohanellus kitauei]|uniref:Sortilin N-terminal domain-containing protein n=1 Tax=Thelohanellus kitauei TaxID=669202 RepID=A0A0C2IAM8_THEKT|nr:hypothetical protein RF11_05409 [Thelohanellus kitauei]
MDGTNTSEKIWYVLKNGEKSFIQLIPSYHDKPIHLDDLTANESTLFGISRINRTFFFADRDLNIISVKIYDKYSLISPSVYDPTYILKITKNRGKKRWLGKQLFISRDSGSTYQKISDNVKK